VPGPFDSEVKPRLRGVLHLYAFVVSLALGAALVVAARGARATAAAAVFAATVAAMFGASALYHRPRWRPRPARWLRRLDHAAIYVLIAGTYTPFGMLVLSGAWQIGVLAVVWSGAAAAVVLKLVWIDAPRWLATALGIGLGWVGVVAFEELVHAVGAAGMLLTLAGGVLYSAGAVVYARRRPDPFPAVFGFHEVFHTLVIAAVACQYAAIAFFVLPTAG
jgi:hemolysin III